MYDKSSVNIILLKKEWDIARLKDLIKILEQRLKMPILNFRAPNCILE